MSLISQWINLLRFTSRLFFWSVGEWTVYMRFVCRFVYFFFFWRCTQSTNKLRVNHMALILVFVAAFPNIWIDLPTPKLNYKKRHPYFIFINNSGSTLIFDGFEMCVARAPTHQPTHSQNTSLFCVNVCRISSPGKWLWFEEYPTRLEDEYWNCDACILMAIAVKSYLFCDDRLESEASCSPFKLIK